MDHSVKKIFDLMTELVGLYLFYQMIFIQESLALLQILDKNKGIIIKFFLLYLMIENKYMINFENRKY